MVFTFFSIVEKSQKKKSIQWHMKFTCNQVSISIHSFTATSICFCVVCGCFFTRVVELSSIPHLTEQILSAFLKTILFLTHYLLFIHLYIRLLDTIPSVCLLFFHSNIYHSHLKFSQTQQLSNRYFIISYAFKGISSPRLSSILSTGRANWKKFRRNGSDNPLISL